MNNKGADQSAQMRRLVSAFVVSEPPEDWFSRIEAYVIFDVLLNIAAMLCLLHVILLLVHQLKQKNTHRVKNVTRHMHQSKAGPGYWFP